MDGMTGAEAIKNIRETDKVTRIVFLTTSNDHVFDAFNVHAYQYILKTPDNDSLKESIYKVLNLFVSTPYNLPSCICSSAHL